MGLPRQTRRARSRAAGVGAVDDQGQGRHPLDGQDQIGQGLPLVDGPGAPVVDHQEVRPLLLLLEGASSHGVVPVLGVQGLLQLPPTGGVDPLPHGGDGVQGHGPAPLPAAEAADRLLRLGAAGASGPAAGGPTPGCGPVWCRSSPPGWRPPCPEMFCPTGRTPPAPHQRPSPPPSQAGQAGVGLDHDGPVRDGQHGLQGPRPAPPAPGSS